MAHRYRKNCRTCIMCRNNPKLRSRLYNAAYTRADDDETLNMISKEIGVAATNLYNHVKRHMKQNQPTGMVTKARFAEKARLTAQKELEMSFDHHEVVPRQDFERVWDQVIADGERLLKSEDKKLSINQILAATKLKSEYMSKRRGQDAEIIKAMYRSMNAAQKPGPMAVGGPEGPGHLLRKTAGDAAA